MDNQPATIDQLPPDANTYYRQVTHPNAHALFTHCFVGTDESGRKVYQAYLGEEPYGHPKALLGYAEYKARVMGWVKNHPGCRMGICRWTTANLPDAVFFYCAAIWIDDGKKHVHSPTTSGVVFCGWRHHNCIETMLLAYPNAKEYLKEQGFLTSAGRFVSREEAARIAFSAKQIEHVSVDLYSEDLY